MDEQTRAEGLRRLAEINGWEDPAGQGYDETTLPGSVAAAARALDPDAFAGAFHEGNVVFTGFTRLASARLASLRTRFPSTEIRLFPAKYSEDALARIQDEIYLIMQSEPVLISVGGEVERNVITVGVTRLSAPIVRLIVLRWGDAVEIISDAPPVPMSAIDQCIDGDVCVQNDAVANPDPTLPGAGSENDPAAAVDRAPVGEIPGVDGPVDTTTVCVQLDLCAERPDDESNNPRPERNRTMDPVLSGAWIRPYEGTNNGGCTAGFMYYGGLQTNVGSGEQGLMTAGHCLAGLAPTTEWWQGATRVGTQSRNRDVQGTFADAGTLTIRSTINFRQNVVPTVFGGMVDGTKLQNQAVVGQKRVNTGMKGDVVCISAGVSGDHCGVLKSAGIKGKGFDYANTRGTYKYVDNAKACKGGDSGSPATEFGVAKTRALGIFFARDVRNPRVCYYSQIGNAQIELNVRLVTTSWRP